MTTKPKDHSSSPATIQPDVELIQQLEPYTQAGLALIWLGRQSKRPIEKNWTAKPRASLRQLTRTYREGYNVGVRLGEPSEFQGLFPHVLDIDCPAEAYAAEVDAKVAELFSDAVYLDMPTVLSGSGGASRHLYFWSDAAHTSKVIAHSDGFQMVWDESKKREVRKWFWSLHILGTGAQAVMPPSIHPSGRPYRWANGTRPDCNMLDLGLAPFVSEAALKQICGDDKHDDEPEPDPSRQRRMGLSETEIIDYLNDLPEAWFEDRDQWMRGGMALHHETDGSEFGYQTWCDYSKTSEKFDEKDQRRVWRSFRDKSAKPFRFASIVAVVKDIRALNADLEDFDDLAGFEEETEGLFDDLLGPGTALPVKKPTPSQQRLAKEKVEIELGRDVPKWVERINSNKAVVRVSSKTMIMDFHEDGRVTCGPVSEVHNWFENDRRPSNNTTVPASKLWLQHPQRRQYPNGIVFAPNKHVEGAYNHWRGFSVQPDPTKSCTLFLKHLREVFCAGNEEHFWYMIGWMAHLVQKPEEKPGVAIVARGRKAAGKDTVFEYLGRLFEHHYITVGNQEQMLGKFNQHQERCLLLHVQEGFWAGDKRAEGQLKYLITSADVMIEPKGMNAFPIKSVLRLCISSNERWVVPATEDERRFFVLNVSDKRRNDHNYFRALREQMENGGREALLAYLLDHDISKFEVRAVPDTAALAEQKVEGLKNVERWWYGVLEQGSIAGSSSYRQAVERPTWVTGSVSFPKADLRESYTSWLRTRKFDGEPVSEADFTKRLKRMLPDLGTSRPRANDGVRENAYVVPSLQTCRASFEAFLGSETSWPDDDNETELVEEDLL